MSKAKPANPTIFDVIESGEDGVFETQHLLARVWRIVLIKSAISGELWYRLITRYQERYRNLESEAKRTSIKGNYSRQLAGDRISWPLLMKGFEIIDFDDIEVNFKFRKGSTVFEIPMTLIQNGKTVGEQDEDVDKE